MEKSLILLSFLTSLFISWTGLLGILGARDRWEMSVQCICALSKRGGDQGIPKKRDFNLEESDRSHRILE